MLETLEQVIFYTSTGVVVFGAIIGTLISFCGNDSENDRKESWN